MATVAPAADRLLYELEIITPSTSRSLSTEISTGMQLQESPFQLGNLMEIDSAVVVVSVITSAN
ncbi:hypothetical protein ACLOJK_005772 [Asimina triloba]